MTTVMVFGTLSKPPETRNTTKGNPFAFSSMRISSPDGDTYANVTAFDSSLVDVLIRLKPGDLVTVCGSGKLSTYTTRPSGSEAAI